MGNSSAGLVRGLDALNVNPAQLVPNDGVTVSLGILPFGAQAGADFIRVGIGDEAAVEALESEVAITMNQLHTGADQHRDALV